MLEEIRLPSFKSVRSATLRLRDLTLLVGRNGSGKSNVLEGVWVLSQLALGGDIRTVLDGARDSPGVRGGVEGCAPLGSDTFELGCTVRTADGRIHLDVGVSVRPVVQVVHERLRYEPHSRKAKPRTLLESEASDLDSADITARWDNRRQGPNPAIAFRASQLLTSQVNARVPATTRAGRDVHQAAETVLEALHGVFVLDPVPHAMRQYVPARDHRLRRRADNLSAVLGRLFEQESVYTQLLEMSRSLSESRIVAMTTEASPLGDLMLVQREIVGGVEATVPARLMSDGTLRVLAILAALFETSVESSQPGPIGDGAATTLVIEEIENGLHPSQAAAMVARVIEESRVHGIHTLATTHSPAMLDSLPGTDHEGVVVCLRDDQGWTRLQPLTELPNYFNVVTGGTLGRAAVQDRLRPATASRTPSELIDDLFRAG